MKQPIRYVLFLSLCVFLGSGSLLVKPVSGQNQDKEKEADQIIKTDVDPSALQNGQRIRIQMKHGTQLRGEVVGLLKKRIKLDMSKEEGLVSGTVTIPLEDVASIAHLKPISADDRKKPEKKSKTNADKKAAQKTKDKSSDKKKEGEKEASKEGAESPESKEKSERENGSSKKEDDTETGKKNGEDPMKLTAEHRQLLSQYPEEKWGQKQFMRLSNKNDFQLNSRQLRFRENWSKIQEARKIKRYQEQEALLQEFHPKDGWTPKKYKYIKENLGSLGVTGVPMRSEEQQRFLDVYPQWEKAYERYKKEQEKKQKEKQASQGGG